MPGLDALFDLLQLVIKERTQLALENIALRQQLAFYKRSVKRPNINDGDRIFWMTIVRFLRECKDAVVIVKPETVDCITAIRAQRRERQAAQRVGAWWGRRTPAHSPRVLTLC